MCRKGATLGNWRKYCPENLVLQEAEEVSVMIQLYSQHYIRAADNLKISEIRKFYKMMRGTIAELKETNSSLNTF